MTRPQLLDMFEVAKILGCSRTHAWDLACKGELGEVADISAKPTSTSTKSRVTEDGVKAFIQRRSRSVSAA